MIMPIDFNLPPREDPESVPDEGIPDFDPEEFAVEYEPDPEPGRTRRPSRVRGVFRTGRPAQSRR